MPARATPLAILLAVLALLTPGARAQPPAGPDSPGAGPAVRAVEAVGMTVADLDRSVAFFRDVLAFVPLEEHEELGDALERRTGVFGARARTAVLALGTERLELTEFLAPAGREIPRDARATDRSFQHIAIVVTDIDRAYARLRAHRVRHASTGPQTLPRSNPSAGGIRAFYFRDPDGHFLELIQFPPGIGDPRWQVPPADPATLFLGIDHTAIVVRDTEASLRFYRDTLALRVAGTSENLGTEQEHLNNVFGARLRITTLRAPEGPGIELLEYLAPGGGREAPADTTAADLWHWHVRLRTDATPDHHAIRRAGDGLVSPGPVDLGAGGVALRARDPDRHVVEFLTASPHAGLGTHP